VALASALFVACAAPARAQAPSRGTVEISGGGAVAGGYDLDRRTAQLTSNIGSTGGAYDFFDVEGRVRASYGVLGRIGAYLSSSFSVEGGVQWLRAINAQRISGDVEGASDITAEETLNQYLFEGSALWHIGSGSAARPFVYGGAGYLRVLHEGDALIEEGLEVHAGFGVKWWLGKRVAVRGEGGVSIRDLGSDDNDKRRTVPVAAGSVIWVF
jgi:hypothetical protein